MTVCAQCDAQNRDDAKFCDECGAPLAVAQPAREQRKTVTVLFCDVTGSTSLGESVDPEALRTLLSRYFERMKAIVESHGGIVEKFIGDAVMAVFGVPKVHEDDALRAVRAAVEMRDALPELGVQARIGVNTGEVVTGTEERLATGDAVNVAARLEQAAQSGEVLIGADTLRLARDVVEVEQVELLELKGKAEPVPAYRLLCLREAPERRHEALFVGREQEVALVREACEKAQAERRCELVTIVGDAGVGKSRLVSEALAAIAATVVHGRCLPYGDGITYWPVVEVFKQLDVLPQEEAAAAAISSLMGETKAVTSAEEIAWGFRKTLELAAAERPLVVVFDDIQWGEETFLDLIEHVALLSSGASILLLCIARPELVEHRPGWRVTFRLDPLEDTDVQRLIPESIAGELREKIGRASGGNPLFIGEMLAMAEETEGEVVVPPTLQALLAARLDQLDSAERSALERGAIEGEIFHRGAIHSLSDDCQVTPRLASLVRKELIRPEKSQIAGDDAFRFRHLLIRDAAYDALPKAARADLHERFARWLDEHGTDLAELDEIVGHHLEQAARYKQELARADAHLAERAGDRLASAGRRALSRGDGRAAAAFLERTLELLRPTRVDVHLELDLASAYALLQEDRRAAAIADAAAEAARGAGDNVREVLARVVAANHRSAFADDPAVDELEALARRGLTLLEEAGDHAGLVHVWQALGNVANFRGELDAWTRSAEHALEHAGALGQSASIFDLAISLSVGPRPADAALRTLEAHLSDAAHPRLILHRAELVAMLGRFAEAKASAERASKQLLELTGDEGGERSLATIATLAGDHESAASYLRVFCEYLDTRGNRDRLSTYAPLLGRTLSRLGRHDDAEPLAQLGREIGSERDVITQVLWRQVQALVHASRDEHDEAERLAREGAALAERTDALNFRGDALCDLAEVLAVAGRMEEAAEALEEALERYERKKNLAMVAQVRPKLESLRKAAPA
jgi:class 3 adenylate cyclase/tetratricopeptide (TPR) repeat protein